MEPNMMRPDSELFEDHESDDDIIVSNDVDGASEETPEIRTDRLSSTALNKPQAEPQVSPQDNSVDDSDRAEAGATSSTGPAEGMNTPEVDASNGPAEEMNESDVDASMFHSAVEYLEDSPSGRTIDAKEGAYVELSPDPEKGDEHTNDIGFSRPAELEPDNVSDENATTGYLETIPDVKEEETPAVASEDTFATVTEPLCLCLFSGKGGTMLTYVYLLLPYASIERPS